MDVVIVVYILCEVLWEVGLEVFVKISGNCGLYIFVFIELMYEFFDVWYVVIVVGCELEWWMFDWVMMNWWKEECGEWIFVDFN